MKVPRLIPIVLASAAVSLAVATTASAEWVVKGRGFGHGVGMSQYGAYGMAQQGKSHSQILKHYYTGVSIGDAPTKKLRVLIASGVGSMSVSGAKKACGSKLRSGDTYSFRIVDGKVSLRNPNGSKRATCGKEGTASGDGSVRYAGIGDYRGDLRARNVGGSLYAINRVGIEGYVQGVIPNESPSSWPGAALRAQAVAARSYALATRIGGDGYDLYDDTRSQVYGGKSSEASSTNRAARATKHEVIKYDGTVATAFFFSTSGGRTENSEFGFPGGGSPRPYLKSVKDPFDNTSPVHKWTQRFSNSEMASKLSGLYSGNFQRIDVQKRGKSPRIVRAKVIGSNGSSEVTGDTIRFRLGLRSTWAKFDRR